MTLDPVDWAATRETGHRMVDDMLSWQESIRTRAPWQPVPSATKLRLDEPVPYEGMPLDALYDTFVQDILPYPTGNVHPRFWGWVMGSGTPTGMLAEMLAAGMNSHVAGYDQAASVIEKQVLAWLKKLMGYPETASGLLVSGGTAANLNGLLAARVARAGWDVREEGLQGGPPLTVYGSSSASARNAACARRCTSTSHIVGSAGSIWATECPTIPPSPRTGTAASAPATYIVCYSSRQSRGAPWPGW